MKWKHIDHQSSLYTFPQVTKRCDQVYFESTEMCRSENVTVYVLYNQHTTMVLTVLIPEQRLGIQVLSFTIFLLP